MSDLPVFERLSYSQLNSWTTCGEQYRLERIVRVPQRPAWNLIGGSTVHEKTEIFDKREHGVDVSDESFEEIFERRTLEAEEKSGFDRSEFRASGRASKAWPDKENDRWWLAEGPAMVNRWVNWVRTTPWQLWLTPQGLPAIELEFDLALEGVVIKGFIDRVFLDPTTQALIVFDLKTGASKQPTQRQLGTYKVALLAKWPDAPVRFGAFWDARTGTTSPAESLHEYDERRLQWQYNVLATARKQNLFLPSPGPLCGSCSVRESCYEYTQGASATVRPPWISPAEWEGEVA